jgi:hypothetical protein
VNKSEVKREKKVRGGKSEGADHSISYPPNLRSPLACPMQFTMTKTLTVTLSRKTSTKTTIPVVGMESSC